MTAPLLPPMHPGEVLREEFLAPLGLSAYALAKAVALSPQHVAAVCSGKRNITVDSALRFGRYFFVDAETGALFWLNLQRAFDLAVSKVKLTHVLEGIRPCEHARMTVSTSPGPRP